MADKSEIAFRSLMPPTLVAESLRAVRPFLKRAGGQRRLLPELRRFVPPAVSACREPFLRSGALLVDQWKTGNSGGIPCQPGGANGDPIGVYRGAAHHTDSVIEEPRKLSELHAQNGAARATRFVIDISIRCGAHRWPAGEDHSPVLAAV
jgi:hypothetical protein